MKIATEHTAKTSKNLPVTQASMRSFHLTDIVQPVDPIVMWHEDVVESCEAQHDTRRYFVGHYKYIDFC